MTDLQQMHARRALIIEDEFLIALDLEATMFELGFDVCALAPSAHKARSLAMNDQPDVAVVDVCWREAAKELKLVVGLKKSAMCRSCS